MNNMVKDFVKNVLADSKGLPYLYGTKEANLKSSMFYSGPYWGEEELSAMIETLMFGSWLPSGPKVAKFEIQFSKYIKNKKSIMVNSGSSANLVMISALKKRFDWLDGDEIILSVVGFPTTLAPLLQNNLKPCFIDIEMDTLNFDLDKIEENINDKTKAIFLSPVLANPPDMDKLIDICNRHNILLVLDNCDSLGTTWKDKMLTEYAYCSSCSFYAAHHICTGEGGMISSDDEEFIRMCRSFAWWGKDCYCVGKGNLLKCGTCNKRFDKWLNKSDVVVDHRYVFTNIGYNLKPLDFQGAIGSIQIQKMPEIHEKRQNHFKRIKKIVLSGVNHIRTVDRFDFADVSWFGFPIICETGELKTKLSDYFLQNKIQTRNYFAGNILLQPAYEHLDDFRKYPNANQVLEKVFFIGTSPHYIDETFEYLENVIKNFKGEQK